MNISKPLMFSKLTREHAVKLLTTHWENRKTEIQQLFVFLEIDGYNYSENASYNLLKDLAPYETMFHNNVFNTKEGIKLPDCVFKCYEIMFNAYEDTLKRIVYYNYEIEVWEDDLSDVQGSCTVWTEQEAIDEYNELVADGSKVRVLQIDLSKEDEDFANAAVEILSNF